MSQKRGRRPNASSETHTKSAAVFAVALVAVLGLLLYSPDKPTQANVLTLLASLLAGAAFFFFGNQKKD